MALPDITFANNLTGGTPILIRNALVGINDRYEWNGTAVRRKKLINVEGYIQQAASPAESGGFERLLTKQLDPLRSNGQIGTLTLPWTTIPNARLVGISYGGDTKWIGWQQVSLQFEDPYPDGNVYQITFFGLSLHNPRLSMDIPGSEPVDDYMQLSPTVGGMNYADPNNAIYRQFGPMKCMEIGVSGTMMNVDSTQLAGIRLTLDRRVGVGNPLLTAAGTLTGWAAPFNLHDACPQLAADFRVAHCIMGAGRLVWNATRRTLQVAVQIIAQPQKVGS